MAGAQQTGAIDVGSLLDLGEWSTRQKAVLALTALAVIFDGFDNQLVGFALPAIIKEWAVSRAAFAPIVAIGLLGMSVGTALCGYLGDRFGRRAALIVSILLFGAATGLTYFVNDLIAFGALRFFAGAGIGGALPNASALTAEFTPLRRRSLAVSLTIVCVPLGGMLAGVVAAQVLPLLGWRMLFAIGGIAPILFAAVLWMLLPESPRYLSRHRERWNELRALLAKTHGRDVGSGDFADPIEQQTETVSKMDALFGPLTRRSTLCLCATNFCSMLSVYFVFNWFPSLLSSQGLGLASTSNGLAAYNFGGVLGAISFAVLIGRIGSRGPLLAATLGGSLSAIAMSLVPLSPNADLTWLIITAGIHGLFVNAVQTALFALSAHVYPTKVRATGVAFAAAIGRTGAILSSFAGAAAIQAGRLVFFEVLALGMLGAFTGLLILRHHIPAGLNCPQAVPKLHQ